MGWIQSLFGRQEKRQARKLDVLVERLEAVMRPSLSLVDARDLTIPEKRERYALFTCGAVSALAHREDLNETETLALLVRFLRSTGRWPDQEISRMVGLCAASTDTEGKQSGVAAGERAMAEWLNGEAGTAVSELSRLLRS